MRHTKGWCALAPGYALDPNATLDHTLCGHVVVMRMGDEKRLPDCPECLDEMSSPVRRTKKD